MQESRKDFFISYTKADRHWGEWIAWQLEEAGFSVVIQAWDFRPGSNFVLEMQQAAIEAERTIAVLSPDYLSALYTQPEWAGAFVQDPTGEKGTLLPVRVRRCELKGLLTAVVYIDLVEQEDPLARERLLEGINRDRVKPKIAPAFPGSKGQTQTDAVAASSEEVLPLLSERPHFPKDLQPTTKNIEVFYAYASEDEGLRTGLEKQLTLLKRIGLISDWHSVKITEGLEQGSEIEKHWQSSQIILLLISDDFMATDADGLAKRAMERHQAETAYVIPIILCPVNWRGTPFDNLDVLPTNKKPITSWVKRDEAFLDVARGIRNAVEELTA